MLSGNPILPVKTEPETVILGQAGVFLILDPKTDGHVSLQAEILDSGRKLTAQIRLWSNDIKGQSYFRFQEIFENPFKVTCVSGIGRASFLFVFFYVILSGRCCFICL